MTLNKHTYLKFIYNGKQYNLKIIFSHKHLDIVPVYISDDIHDIMVLEIRDNSVVVIVNSSLYNKYNKETIEIIIMANILKIYYKDCKSDSIIDICCAYWFGFTKVINIIMNAIDISTEQKDKRIEMLEKVITSENDMKIPTQEFILKNIKFVDVA